MNADYALCGQFEDVGYATKTLNELYGNTLGGLIKGGGIRLSYSKNPLGVRTPTSAGSNVGAPGLQQQQQQQQQLGLQQQQQGFGQQEAAFHPRLTSPPPSQMQMEGYKAQQQSPLDAYKSPLEGYNKPPLEQAYMPTAPAPRFYSGAGGNGGFVPRALYGFGGGNGNGNGGGGGIGNGIGGAATSAFSPFSHSPAPVEEGGQ